MAEIDGGDRRGRVPLCVGRGSTSAGTAEDVDRADGNEGQDDNDFDPHFQSVRSTSTGMECSSTSSQLLLVLIFLVLY